MKDLAKCQSFCKLRCSEYLEMLQYRLKDSVSLFDVTEWFDVASKLERELLICASI